MHKSILAAVAATALCAATANAQSTATPVAAKGGINAGSLSCIVAGGAGFVFGSSKALDCIFVPPNGAAERYIGTVKKFGVDIGFTQNAQILWIVFAPGLVAPGALAGDYVGGTAGAAVGAGIGANVLIGGGNRQISLQPVSVEGSVGLNVAAGFMAVELRKAR
jgi:hypothetical protein